MMARDDGEVSHSAAPVVILLSAPDTDDSRCVLRAYFEDLASRFYQRPATGGEIDAAMAEDPSDDLTPPHGLFMLAYGDAGVIGCAGLRMLPGRLGEVTRVFVIPSARRLGLGARLLDEVEQAARTHGVSRLRLDTRSDLVEARHLYESRGYLEVPQFSSGPYAQHWFEKPLG
jgi:GNAT superfamily N-acetyltransferase